MSDDLTVAVIHDRAEEVGLVMVRGNHICQASHNIAGHLAVPFGHGLQQHDIGISDYFYHSAVVI